MSRTHAHLNARMLTETRRFSVFKLSVTECRHRHITQHSYALEARSNAIILLEIELYVVE
jgi:hypothetical protein